jgi:hypothetical protein
MADKFNLVDPFRALYPNKMAFSYRPFGTQRKNMSRIDFFLVSSNLLEKIHESDIFSAHISSAFDHKPVTLIFRCNKQLNHAYNNKKKIITNWFLDEKVIQMSVQLSALQVYSRAIDEGAHADLVNSLHNAINFLNAKILETLQMLEKIALNVGSDNSLNEMLLAALYADFAARLEQLPSWEHLNDARLKFTKKEFFIALAERLTDKVSSTQIKLTKLKNFKKKTIRGASQKSFGKIQR